MGDEVLGSAALLRDEQRETLRRAAAECHEHGAVSPDSLTVLRTSGLLTMCVPQEYGGHGYDTAAANAVIRDLASLNPSVAIMVYLHCAVVERIRAYGTEDQKQRWFARIVDQKWLAASAWSEVGASADKRSLGTVATRAASGTWRMSGGKTFSTSSTVADFFIVLAQMPDDPAGTESDTPGYGRANQLILLIPADAAGVRVAPEALPMLGMRGSGTGMVQFTDAAVPAEDVLCLGEDTPRAIQLPHRLGLTLGAVSVGTAEAALRILTEHFKDKGRLPDPDARRHLARLSVTLQAARSMVDDLAHRAPHESAEAAYAVKVFTTTASQEVCASVRDLLGSSGYMRGHEANRIALDADAVVHMGPPNHLCVDLIAAKA